MPDAQPANDRELMITRIIEIPREKLFRCWTDPELLKQWFCPRPWRVTEAAMDMRPGGSNYFLMEGPNGERIPNRGVYLEVIPNERIVFTDAFVQAWVPSQKAFMVAEVTFEDIGGGRTRYTAIARHWNAEDRATHEQMGFHPGWNAAADQMEELARTL